MSPKLLTYKKGRDCFSPAFFGEIFLGSDGLEKRSSSVPLSNNHVTIYSHSNCKFPPNPNLLVPVLPVFGAAPVQPSMQILIGLLQADPIANIRIEIPPTVLLLYLLQASRFRSQNYLQPAIFDLNPN
jgi:hypothetical protein